LVKRLAEGAYGVAYLSEKVDAEAGDPKVVVKVYKETEDADVAAYHMELKISKLNLNH
jgi:hypothetical protein